MDNSNGEKMDNLNREKGELILKFSSYDKKLPQDKYLGRIKKPTTITRTYTKFKIDAGKCRSYLDIHLPDIVITDDILERCSNIFKLVLRYSDGGECECENNMVLWTEDTVWRQCDLNTDVFYDLFNSDPLCILCADPDDSFAVNKEYSLESILLEDKKYDIFLEHWSKQYNIVDLIDTLTFVSQMVLKNSGNCFPLEIVEMILCFAKDLMLKETFY